MKNIKSPAEIERESMKIIDGELSGRGIVLPSDRAAIVKRAIHATADFDYAETLWFTPNAVSAGKEVMRGGVIVTDTNMVLSGINRTALNSLGASAYCFMGEEFTAQEAHKRGITRAAVSVEYALEHFPRAVFAVGNAPTALLRLAECMEQGARPAFIIGVPVGFVNVTESKKHIRDVCERFGIPAIIAMGRKGGSSVAAAICNALLYAAAGMSDPCTRI